MTWIQALWFAAVQGITELFPVSSVAHAVMLPAVLHWPVDPDGLLPFTVMLHLGTAFALLLFYWREWLSLIGSLFHSRAPEKRRVFVLLVVATIPAAVIGGLFEKTLRAHFPSAASAAFFLMVNGVILWIGDRQRRRAMARSGMFLRMGREDEEIARLGLGQSFLIGSAQCLALIPGFSRSGMTMIAGLYAGLGYEAAARFAFLLATPVILGAGILEVPKLFHDQHRDLLGPALVGGLAAGVAAFVSVWILTRYFQQQEVRAFRPFAIYCLVIGLVALLYFVL
ncbi:undecaprenyl-diphosphate phosphatase [Kyrpidia sp.]|uniref:undecaprenyl-diphosphate phosphatase n=1 Tax=Kyrpidia sp. TaxID=2073077 RepID=UPI0025872086|nr:undecaprenyl-diphosphate phosphatase [Kyrpidia sp.]MCL6577021.1 undecaprenyl-diphosphate phosphatase [Kyrpidia sp.]